MVKHLYIQMALINMCGCVSVISGVATTAGTQIVIDNVVRYDNKPHTICRVEHLVESKNFCRVKRTYAKL